jgi:hypothetical protein
MAEKEEKPDQVFQVKDRRRFSEDGARKETPGEDVQGKEKTEAKVAPDEGTPATSDRGSEGRERGQAHGSGGADLPEVNFSTFVFSLSSSILIHLGLVTDPLTGQISKDLPLAKQTIDILSMLQQKTRGNLDKEEAKLLETLLFDLKMRYVEGVKQEPA